MGRADAKANWLKRWRLVQSGLPEHIQEAIQSRPVVYLGD
jgi:hypothetical protein